MARDLMQLEGAKELMRTLDRMDRKHMKKAVRAGLASGSVPIIKAAKSRLDAHKHTGNLKKSIGRVIRTYGGGETGRIVSIIGPQRGAKGDPKGPKGYHGHFLEFGTGPRHTKSGAYRGMMPAQPFMRPAYDSSKGKVLTIMARKIRERIAKMKGAKRV